MAGQRASEAQSYAISLPQLPAGLPGRVRSLEPIVRGFSKVSSEASRSLKTPLAFHYSAVDVYRALLAWTKPGLAQRRSISSARICGPRTPSLTRQPVPNRA